MAAVRGESFYGEYRFAGRRGERDLTGPDGLAVEMHGAGAALPQPAPELGPGQLNILPQYPKQRRGWIGVHALLLAVHGQGYHL